MGRRRLRTGAGLATLAVLAVGAAAVATARAPVLEAVTATQHVGESGHAQAVAACPRHTDVVSGGFAAPNRHYAGGGPYTESVAAHRLDDRHFAVKARDVSPTRRSQINAYAYCGNLGRITVASATSEPIRQFGAGGSAVAKCPAGRVAISGGFKGVGERGQPELLAYVSRRVGDRKWRVAAESAALKGEHSLVAYAYCAKPPRGLVTRAHNSPIPKFNQSSAGSACEPGEEAIAGGFKATRPGGGRGSAEVYTSHRVNDGRRWKVSIVNGDDDVKDVRVFAYCLPAG